MSDDGTTRADRLRAEDPELDGALARVRAALRGLRFGQVTLVVHDGSVVQVERTEKIRVGR